MKKTLLTAAATMAFALMAPTTSSAGILSFDDCKTPGLVGLVNSGGTSIGASEGKRLIGGFVAFASSNTNAGDGNGGEIVSIIGGGCASEIEAEDSGFNLNAFSNGGILLATDPGNSLPNTQGPQGP